MKTSLAFLLLLLVPQPASAAVQHRQLSQITATGYESVTYSLITPDASTVFFIMDQYEDESESYSGELYRMSATGGAATLITKECDYLGGISPDGSKLVFRSYRSSGTDGLFTYDISSGAISQLTTVAGYNVHFTSDSVTVVFEGYDAIYSVPLAGGTVRQLTPSTLSSSSAYFYHWEITADDDWVISHVSDTSTHDEYILSGLISTGVNHVLFTNDVDGFRLAPDGSRVVVIQNDSLYSVKPNGTSQVLIDSSTDLPYGASGAVVSADSAWVYYAKNNLYKADITGATAPTLVATPPGGIDRFSPGLCLSPDGTYIALITDTVSGPVYSFNTATSALTAMGGPDANYSVLTDNDVQLVITPDSQRVIWSVSSSSHDVLYAARLNGVGSPHQITQPSLSSSSNDVSIDNYGTAWDILPDSSAIIYRVDDVTADAADVYHAPLNGTARTKLSSTMTTTTSTSLETDFNISPDSTFITYTGFHLAAATPDSREMDRVAIPAFTRTKLASTQLTGADVMPGYGDIDEVQISPDGNWAVFVASESSYNVEQLIAVRTDGTAHADIGPALTFRDHFGSIVISPDSSRVAYSWYDESAGKWRLQSVAIAGGSITNLSTAGESVEDEIFHFTPDSARIVFAVDATYPGSTWNLYSVPSAGGTRTLLNANGFEVIGSSYYGVFALSPDGTKVAYRAYHPSVTDQIEINPVTGGTPTVLGAASDSDYLTFSPDGAWLIWREYVSGTGYQIKSTSTTTGGVNTLIALGAGQYGAIEFQITPDSTQVVAIADFNTGYKYELGVVPIAGGTSPTVISGAIIADGDVDEFLISEDGSRVVYTADGFLDGQMELYSVLIDGTSHVRLNLALPPGGDVTDFAITPNSDWVLYRADENTLGQFELVKVPVGFGLHQYLSGSLPLNRSVEDDFIIASDGGHALYRADADNDDVLELYSVDLISHSVVRMSNSMIAAGDVSHFRVADHGQLVVYRADAAVDETYQLHSAWSPPTITPITNVAGLTNTALGPIAITIQDNDLPAQLLTLSSSTDNPTLLPVPRIHFGGSGSARTVTLDPAPGQTGVANVTVTVSDGAFSNSDTFRAVFTSDPNDAPTNIQLMGVPIPENVLAGTAVANLATVDADTWDSHLYMLVPGFGATDNSSFTIAGNKLIAQGPFDFETKPTLTVRIRSTDLVGAMIEKAFPITLLDVTGIPQPIEKTLVRGASLGFISADWTSHFILADGGTLQKIKFPSLPAHGTLFQRYKEFTIDTTLGSPRAIAVGKVNADALTDVAVVSDATQTLAWYEQIPGPSLNFLRHIVAAGAALNGARDVRLVDLDLDGDSDIVVAAQVANQIVWYENLGGAVPAFVQHIAAAANAVTSVNIADVDHDGKADIVASIAGPGEVRWFRNNGASPPAFLSQLVSNTEPGTNDTVPADLDGDGDIDIVCASTTNNETVWFESNGAPMPLWTRHVAATPTNGVRAVGVADLDADGKADIIHADAGPGTLNWNRNLGGTPATFGPMPAISTSIGTVSALRIADVDGDGRKDILASVPVSGQVLTYRNTPAMFETFAVDTSASGADGIAVGDLNGNGKPEIFSVSHISSEVTCYIDEVALSTSDEVTSGEFHKIAYTPTALYVGQDSFKWKGWDGVQWSATDSVVHFTIYGPEYMAWLTSHFASTGDPATKASIWGPYADADGDGRANIMEYALGTDPNDSSDASDGTTQALADDGSGDTYLYYSYLYLRNEPSLTYTLESSTDLHTWNSGPTWFQFVSDAVIDASYSQATYKALPSTTVEPSLFVRLSVTWAIE